MTADRGLCGSFNVNLINTAVKFIREKEAAGIEVSLICVGRKGRDFFRRRKREMLAQYVDVWNKFDFSNAVTVAREVMSAFLTGGVQEVHLIHCQLYQYGDPAPQNGAAAAHQARRGGGGSRGQHRSISSSRPWSSSWSTCCPSISTCMVYHGFLENSASEYAARMTAMDNAQATVKK